MKRKMLPALAVFVAHLLVLPSAQAYPDRPIKLVVPSPAGGPPDQIARLISDKMAAALGQPVIVENRTGGAGGIIGAKSGVRSTIPRAPLRQGAPARALASRSPATRSGTNPLPAFAERIRFPTTSAVSRNGPE